MVGLEEGTRCKMFGRERKLAEKRDEREKEKEENSGAFVYLTTRMH